MIEVGGRQLIVFVWHLRWCHLVSSGDHVKLPLLRGVIKIQFTKYKIQNADSVLWSTAAQHPLSRVCDQNAIVDVQVSSGRKQQQQRPLFHPPLFNISIINITQSRSSLQSNYHHDHQLLSRPLWLPQTCINQTKEDHPEGDGAFGHNINIKSAHPLL